MQQALQADQRSPWVAHEVGFVGSGTGGLSLVPWKHLRREHDPREDWPQDASRRQDSRLQDSGPHKNPESSRKIRGSVPGPEGTVQMMVQWVSSNKQQLKALSNLMAKYKILEPQYKREDEK